MFGPLTFNSKDLSFLPISLNNRLSTTRNVFNSLRVLKVLYNPTTNLFFLGFSHELCFALICPRNNANTKL